MIIGRFLYAGKSFLVTGPITYSHWTPETSRDRTLRMIVVIDYNVGNVKSVCNAFRHIGCEAELSRDPARIVQATGLVLPGVAAFGYAMEALGDAAGPVKMAAATGKPVLGICVGHQLLFDESTEYGPHKGLGLIQGRV
ncbi:MAG: hypothetical protein ABFE13_05625, partial [Phycisphaerales bacterium]